MSKAHDSIDKCIAQHEGGNKKFQRGGQTNPLSVPPVPRPVVPLVGENNPGGDNQTMGYNPHHQGPHAQNQMEDQYEGAYEDGGKADKKKRESIKAEKHENRELTDEQKKKKKEILSGVHGSKWMLKHKYPDLFGYQQSDEQKKEREYQKKLWRDTKEHREKVGWGKPGKAGSKTKVPPYIKDTDKEKDKK